MKILVVDQEFQKWSDLLKCKTLEEGKELTGINGNIIEMPTGKTPSWGFSWLGETQSGLRFIDANFDTSD